MPESSAPADPSPPHTSSPLSRQSGTPSHQCSRRGGCESQFRDGRSDDSVGWRGATGSSTHTLPPTSLPSVSVLSSRTPSLDGGPSCIHHQPHHGDCDDGSDPHQHSHYPLHPIHPD